jgi:hypothetical protein
MAEPEDVDLQEAFAQFRADSTTDGPVPDLAGVRGRARRRQVTRRAMLSVVALAVLAVPVVGYRLAAQQAEMPVGRERVHPVASEPTERPSEGPSGKASTSSATIQKPVTRDDVMAATLSIPAWPEKRPCASGEVDLGKLGAVSVEQQLAVGKVIQVDVDRDGDAEAVAILSCGYEATIDQVLAVGRDSQGALRTLARVVSSGDATPLMDLVDLRPGDDGAVDVRVGDRIGEAEQGYVERQWRSYRWNGKQFTQVSGPRQFTPVAPSTDLGLTVTTTPFGAPSGGMWSGGITVNVTNGGPNRAPGVLLDLYITTADSGGLSKQLRVSPECTVDDVRADGRLTGVHVVCHQATLASGGNREVAFQVQLPVANGPRALNVSAFVYAEQPNVRVLSDVGGLANSSILTLGAPAG